MAQRGIFVYSRMGIVLSHCLSLDYRTRYGHCLPSFLSDAPARDPCVQCGDCIETFFETFLKEAFSLSTADTTPQRRPDEAMDIYEIRTPRSHQRHQEEHHRPPLKKFNMRTTTRRRSNRSTATVHTQQPHRLSPLTPRTSQNSLF